MPPVFRFAPSPNGKLHLGHAYSALLNAKLAAGMGGRFLLRLEDIDITRCNEKLAAEMLKDLAWLGLTWEEPVRVQSQHWDDYKHAAAKLRERGLLYPCFCSRKEIAEVSAGQDPDGAPLYRGTCSYLSPEQAQARLEEPHSWRLDMQKAMAMVGGSCGYNRFNPGRQQETFVQAEPGHWGDVIIVRKETPTSYHLSVVVDDALQGITHIVRGTDLEKATDVHVVLQKLLGLSTPLYHHHRLLEDIQSGKLSKSKDSETLADLRARGISAQEIKDLFAASPGFLL